MLAYAIAFLLAFASVAATQQPGRIVVAAGTAPRIAATRGAPFSAPLIVEMPRGTYLDLAALTVAVTWDPVTARLDSVRAGTFGTLVHNTTEGPEGRLLLSVYSGAGTRSTVTVAVLHFTAALVSGETALNIRPTVAGNQAGRDVMSSVAARQAAVCVDLPSSHCGTRE
jgi:hypothetical protein